MKIAILISGRGSNMAALLAYAAQADTDIEAVAVFSDNPDAKGLTLAREKNIATQVIAGGDEAALAKAINAKGAEVICLAGYMRILSPGFCARYDGRIVNIHPSLLPKYKGLDTHARAIAGGDSIAGCSVHFVSAELDGGAVIAQRRVAIADDETPATLAAKVLAQEHMLYPATLAALAAGLVRLGADGAVVHESGNLAGAIQGLPAPLKWPLD